MCALRGALSIGAHNGRCAVLRPQRARGVCSSSSLSWLVRLSVSELSAECFRERFVLARVPVLIEDGAAHWAALQRWGDVAYLEAALGDAHVTVEQGRHLLASEFARVELPFREFVRRQFRAPVPPPPEEQLYLAEADLVARCPALAHDFNVPPVLVHDAVQLRATLAWLGGAHTHTPLHYDDYHNLYAQVAGTKDVVLIAASEAHKLYPHPQPPHQNVSQVDVACPDLRAHPLFGTVTAERVARVTLTPGALLYIPPGTWHAMTARAPLTCSLSFWFEFHRRRLLRDSRTSSPRNANA